MLRRLLCARAPVRRFAMKAAEINPRLLQLDYSILGDIFALSQQIQADLDAGKPYPFPDIIVCHAGDCQAAGQPPITFFRQLAALCIYPDLFDHRLFPSDVQQRAERILASCGGRSMGAYAHPLGIRSIREDIAAFISRRDGIPVEVDNIALTTGATGGMDCLINALSTDQQGSGRAGILIPRPGYPLYGAHSTKYGNFTVGYHLDEDRNWGISEAELERVLEEVKGQCRPRALVIINPGNPSGQVLSPEDLRDTLRTAHKHNLTVIADEVYQENVYGLQPFVSARKVLHEMGPPYSEEVELVSFMSISKGYYSECGLRCGYFELTNTAPDVKQQLYKDLSLLSSTPTVGQVVLSGVVNPPVPGEPSFEVFDAERAAILGDLKAKAEFMTEALNSLPGITCADITAAMYAFPRLELPPGVERAAREMGMVPDAFFATELLKRAGVCSVPGTGFGQLPGTAHIRLTFVPSLLKLREVIERMRPFLADFRRRFE